MRSIYDAVGITTSVVPQTITGTTAGTTVNGTTVDTKGYNTAMIHTYAGPVTAAGTLTVTLQESASATTGFVNALDNTGTVIGFTLVPGTVLPTTGSARIEGLGLNRLRYLRVVNSLTSATSGISTTVSTVLLGRAYNEPVRTGVSNT